MLNDISTITLFSIYVISTLVCSYFIFCRRSADQRPLFVSIQMISLNFNWLILVPFYCIVLTQQHDYHQDYLTNTLATVGDIGYIIHDGIFVEAHLKASLFLPIALDSINVSNGS